MSPDAGSPSGRIPRHRQLLSGARMKAAQLHRPTGWFARRRGVQIRPLLPVPCALLVGPHDLLEAVIVTVYFQLDPNRILFDIQPVPTVIAVEWRNE